MAIRYRGKLSASVRLNARRSVEFPIVAGSRSDQSIAPNHCLLRLGQASRTCKGVDNFGNGSKSWSRGNKGPMWTDDQRDSPGLSIWADQFDGAETTTHRPIPQGRTIMASHSRGAGLERSDRVVHICAPAVAREFLFACLSPRVLSGL